MPSPVNPVVQSTVNEHIELFPSWFSLSDLDALFKNSAMSPSECRIFLTNCSQQLNKLFLANTPIESLIRGRSWLIDQLLLRSWQHCVGDIGAALVAVGGYGRNELSPGSDIDLMVLLSKKEDQATAEKLEKLLMLLWDMGLEVGHSVRTLDDCQEQAAADITVATNLMEARLLCGSKKLFEEMLARTSPDQVWPNPEFFSAKLKEQQKRYQRFDDAVYNLEPNVKEGPGGLRDAQMIGWVAKRHFGSDDLNTLVQDGFLTEDEYKHVIEGQHFLWKVRFGLHMITGRREDRLLFDHQRTLASQFGYEDHDHTLAIEWFMKDYYRTIQELSRLNELLLQLLEQVILYADSTTEATLINRRFQMRNSFLEATNDNIFKRYPFALLELFLIMQQHPELKGVSAATIRLIRDHRYLINDEFRDDIRNKSLFMEIFRQPHGLTHELRRMNRYGILAAYYPVFENIVGQMQHDLFHAYTVDEHTLFVIRNMRRFTVPAFSDEAPLCHRISGRIPKPELLYLAGFFHDIAKGRGGNHAELGACDALVFLALHQVSPYDRNMVAWLVENHLLMSSTAQRRDISDIDVITEFAQHVGDRTRLDYLYLLTVADIRGTNPSLWNNWRGTLLRDLYNSTRHALRRGLENPQHRGQLIEDIKTKSLLRLSTKGLEREVVEPLWSGFPNDYFLRHSANEVVWHTSIILKRTNPHDSCVDLLPKSERGGSALFIYTQALERLFTRTTALLDQLGLSITDARILTSADHFSINTYQILDADGEPIHDYYQAEELVTLIKEELDTAKDRSKLLYRPPNRRERHFSVPTKIIYHLDKINHRTIIELMTSDSPGLLSRISQVFDTCKVILQNAKITTYGSWAEDVFYVTDATGQPLDEDNQQMLKKALIAMLDEAEA